MSVEEAQQVKLVASDKQEFLVARDVAEISKTVAGLLEETEASSVPIPNVNGPTLGRVLEYCKYHAAAKSTSGKKEGSKNEEEIKAWDNDYIKVETNILFEIMLAANYLCIEPLLDLACLTTANMIKGKTPEEIRTKFNIKNDFTPEEEMEVRKENAWAFD